jgi:hypothetical protein
MMPRRYGDQWKNDQLRSRPASNYWESHPFDKFNDLAVATELLANLYYTLADQTQGYDGVFEAGSGRKREAACPDHERFCGTLCQSAKRLCSTGIAKT